jgi:beta-glucosidase
VATDFYHRFREDVQLMKQAGLTHYRTSINWSRFLTDYENGVVDEEYAAYYDQLFDEMARNRIVPMICLEHYELPGYLLETYGGWASKKVVELYLLYVEKVLNAFTRR